MAHIQFNLNFDELKEKILTSNLDDILKSTMVLVLNEYMKQEQTDYLNAQSYERSSDRRDYRNGYYERELLMSIGNVPLRVPRTRSGEFHTSAFEKYERSDQSFLLALVEMVVNGVSTRKVTNVVNKLCGENVSKSFVSSLTKKLDPVVEEWANRSLSEIYYPYVFVDAMYVKVREYNRVVSKAIYIATAIDDNGKRHVLGFDVDHEESYEAWKDFLHRLKQRGLQAPRLVISDAHSGLKKAIQRVFVGTAWQRCTVHFKRNVIDKMPKKGIQEVKNDFKRIYNGSSTQEARNIKNEFIEKYKDQPKLEKAIHTLEEGFEDTIQYLVEPLKRHQFIPTNFLEHLNQEVRRRERVIRIFPNNQSAYRLVGAILMDHEEELKKKKRTLF